MPEPSTLLWRYSSCASNWDDSCYSASDSFRQLSLALKLLTPTLWLAVWAYLEFKYRKRQQSSRLLTHLRYGPIATALIAVGAIIVSDAMLIQYSRWKLVKYIHSNASPVERPSFDLHNNYRHWCGNGMAAMEYELYGATPAAYIDSPDAEVRARALQASMYVYDWINHPGDGPSMRVLREAVNDPDPLVRRIALEYQAEFFGEPLH